MTPQLKRPPEGFVAVMQFYEWALIDSMCTETHYYGEADEHYKRLYGLCELENRDSEYLCAAIIEAFHRGAGDKIRLPYGNNVWVTDTRIYEHLKHSAIAKAAIELIKTGWVPENIHTDWASQFTDVTVEEDD